MGRRFITVYEMDRVYGGAEEGGWYYTTYSVVYSKKVSSAKTAKREMDRLRNLWGNDCRVCRENKKELFSLEDNERPRYC